MATQTKTSNAKTSNPVTDSLESAAERVAQINEKTAETSKKAAAQALETYEKAVLTVADTYEKAAADSKLEWFSNLASVQANYTREITKAYADAARSLAS